MSDSNEFNPVIEIKNTSDGDVIIIRIGFEYKSSLEKIVGDSNKIFYDDQNKWFICNDVSSFDEIKNFVETMNHFLEYIVRELTKLTAWGVSVVQVVHFLEETLDKMTEIDEDKESNGSFFGRRFKKNYKIQSNNYEDKESNQNNNLNSSDVSFFGRHFKQNDKFDVNEIQSGNDKDNESNQNNNLNSSDVSFFGRKFTQTDEIQSENDEDKESNQTNNLTGSDGSFFGRKFK